MIATTPSGEKLVVVLLGETIADINKHMFIVTYENNGRNLKKTCEALGIAYRTARNWKKKLEVDIYGETSKLPEGF